MSRRAASGWSCLLISLIFSLLALSCEPNRMPSESVRLRMAGGRSARPLLEQLMNSYTSHYPRVSFEIESTSPRLSLNLLRAGQCDLMASSWPPSDTELNPDPGAQRLLKTHIVAPDGLALIVHPKNPVNDLSIAQLRDLFSGRISDWREIEGKVGDVLVISREDGSDDRKTFEALVMDKHPVTLGAIVMPTGSDVVKYVASHPNAIGYAPISEIGPEVKPIALEGISPTYETIQNGSYPLWRHLAIIAAYPPEQPAQDFLNFASGPQGQSVVHDYYTLLRW